MALTSAAVNLSTDASGVASKSVQYQAMEQMWHLPEALLSGTQGMRNLGETYLPRNDMETSKQYQDRVKRTFLYNAYADTIQKLADKPFQKPVVLENDEDLPLALQAIEFNVDFSGRDINDFAKDLVEDASIYGKTHILVDFPRTGGATTLKEERDRAARPSFIHITARDLIGWQMEDNEAGVSELVQIRFCEQTVEPDGEYGDRTVVRIRVWTKTTWELWEEEITGTGRNKTSAWFLVGSGENTLGYIPLVTLYFKREGMLTSSVPMADLAWVNLEHWQSSSEQRNILHVVRIAMLFAKGFDEELIKKGITVSANGMIATENTDADVKWVEHDGKALQSGADDLKNLENRMEVLGLQPLIQKSSASTATGIAVSEGRANTKIQAWIRVVEAALLKAYVVAADWTGDLSAFPENFKVNIFNDFGVAARDQQELQTLTTARLAGEIDHTTYINELRRRGVLSEAAEAEQIDSNLEEEQGEELKSENENFIDDNTDDEDGAGAEGEGEE